MSRRTDFIRDWYRWNLDAPRHEWDTPTLMMIDTPLGLRVRGQRITEPDGTLLGEFIRLTDGPLLRLVLPNALTIGRHEAIRSVVRKEGGEAVTVPNAVLHEAEIYQRSIEVIASSPGTGTFRAEEQLIRAEVHPSTWMIDLRDWRGRRLIRSTPHRTAYFLSGSDHNERGLSYFFCELPPGVEPTTVAEAYESLKPESVKNAERRGIRGIRRQGDMFLIPMKNFAPEEEGPLVVHDATYLHATNHRATQVIFHEGLTYARGVIEHAPSGRRPDHRRLRLGYRKWYLVVKNTVPVTGR